MEKINKMQNNLIINLQCLLDRVAEVRQLLLNKGFAPKANGCVCEGTALCAHHAAVYNHLQQAADSLALAITEAGREE